jgi:hypothetical protein
MGGLRRLVVAVGLLVGCSHPVSTGPAWPKASTQDKDGGESLAPHESKQMAVALEKEDAAPAPAAKPKPDAPAVVPASEGGGVPTTVAVPGPAVEDAITTEDIIIEIDD